jgi:hypothetical protein
MAPIFQLSWLTSEEFTKVHTWSSLPPPNFWSTRPTSYRMILARTQEMLNFKAKTSPWYNSRNIKKLLKYNSRIQKTSNKNHCNYDMSTVSFHPTNQGSRISTTTLGMDGHNNSNPYTRGMTSQKIIPCGDVWSKWLRMLNSSLKRFSDSLGNPANL